ncbi:MAG: hypothetical protein HY709_04780 [Candidatus Latescibacteria bacterium]|nr:hypothetical protein [Candidatus Latescibacterota bacterium]
MRLSDKQIEKLSEAWMNLGTVWFLGGGIALLTSERLLTKGRIIIALLGWLLCQIASLITLRRRD